MCQVTSADRFIATANGSASSAAEEMKLLAKSSGRSNGLRVLICSESVPPQVNGIARRIGMYADGLRNLGCDVGERNMLYAYYVLYSHARRITRESMELYRPYDDYSSLSTN